MSKYTEQLEKALKTSKMELQELKSIPIRGFRAFQMVDLHNKIVVLRRKIETSSQKLSKLQDIETHNTRLPSFCMHK